MDKDLTYLSREVDMYECVVDSATLSGSTSPSPSPSVYAVCDSVDTLLSLEKRVRGLFTDPSLNILSTKKCRTHTYDMTDCREGDAAENQGIMWEAVYRDYRDGRQTVRLLVDTNCGFKEAVGRFKILVSEGLGVLENQFVEGKTLDVFESLISLRFIDRVIL